MEEAGDRNGVSELVVDPDGFAGLGDVRLDGRLFQVGQRGGIYMQLQIHAAREHDHGGAVRYKLFHVGGLSTWPVLCAGLGPVPCTSTSGIELEILAHAKPIHVNTT